MTVWFGVLICLAHSALFSGLTIGFFGLSRLRLEVLAESGDRNAKKILSLRMDSNFLLATLLWGNVAVNVLLTILTDSVFTGFSAFIISTIGITCFGEIMPQAYFSRSALSAGSVLVPFVKFYEWVLYPFSKPTAMALDRWLGKEGAQYFKEDEFKIMLKKHAQSNSSDVGLLEAAGASNFLALDDIFIGEEGEIVDPRSIIELQVSSGLPAFPKFERISTDPFLQKVESSKKKWVILADEAGHPQLVLNADHFLRDVLYETKSINPYTYCHRPILVTVPETKLGQVILKFNVEAQHREDDVVDNDIIVCWGKEKRIITGADILGRLLRGIVTRQDLKK